MQFKKLLNVGLMLAASAMVPLFATPITYTYAGQGSGALGTQSFTRATFTFTAQADTANITPWVSAGGGPQNTHLSATINIEGLGTFSVLSPSHTWLAQNCCAGLGANLGANWITLNEPSFTSIGYGLATNLGPIVDNSPDNINQFNGVSTSGGNLSFSDMTTVTFTATTGSDVPEPSTLAAAGIGCACLLLLRRREVSRG